MAATFEQALPTTRDVIRFALGDVAAPFDLDDELIDGVLDKATEAAGTDQDELDNVPVTAAVHLANLLATLYAKRATQVTQGAVRRAYGERSAWFSKLAHKIATEGLVFDGPGTTLVGTLPVGLLTEPKLVDARYF